MSFMTLVIFSSILFSFGLVTYHEFVLMNLMNMNSVNDSNNKTVYLYRNSSWKQQPNYSNDGLMIVVYIAIIVGVVAPHIPQID